MKSHAIVVGAGAVGCLSALELVNQGWHVSLIDQGSLGREASWAGGGILFPLLPWSYAEQVNQLALAGAARYPALCDELLHDTGIDSEFQVCGMLVSQNFGGKAAFDWCRDNEISFEMHHAHLWLPDVAQVRNPKLIQALRAKLGNAGVQIVENTELIPLQENSHRINTWDSVDGRRFQAETFILTAGAWSRKLLGVHALDIPIKPMRGQMLLYQLAPGVLTHILYHEGFYLIPRKDGHILAGSTVEDAGFDKSITAEAAEMLKIKAAALLPELEDAPIIKQWSGLRPGAPGNLPIIDRHPQFDNLWLNTGHFRYGVTMAPASAGILSELVAGVSIPNIYPFNIPGGKTDPFQSLKN